MPEWFSEAFGEPFQGDADVKLTVLASRMAAAFVLGCVIGGIYRLTHGKGNGQAAGLLATLVLLTVLIAVVTLVIGNSVARAFSLVGALAIVRFRTVVEDTRDTAFVIFAVALGLAVGAGYLKTALMGIPFAAVAAYLFRPRDAGPARAALDFTLRVRVGVGPAPDDLLGPTLGKHLERSRLLVTATARQGAAFELTYAVRLRRQDAAVALVAELNGLEGVQEVELRQA